LPSLQHRRRPDRGRDIHLASFPDPVDGAGSAGSWRVRCRHLDRTAGTTGLRQPPTTGNPGGRAMITSPATAASPATSSCAPPSPARSSPPSRSRATAARGARRTLLREPPSMFEADHAAPSSEATDATGASHSRRRRSSVYLSPGAGRARPTVACQAASRSASVWSFHSSSGVRRHTGAASPSLGHGT
jgi:hypothetical protein